MSGLLSAEFLKLRKRWMPYVLFVLMIIGAAAMIWFLGYLAWTDNDDRQFQAEALRTFAYPYSIPTLLDSGQFWGAAFFVSILTTSTVATEHNWGTIRPELANGVSRARYLAAKLLILTAVSVVALMAALGVGIIFSLIATSIADVDPAVPRGFTAADFVVMILRTALCILPYGLLAFTLTVISRSTALGIAGTMGYMVLEAIIVAAFGTGGEILRDSRIVFLGNSVTPLINENRLSGLDYTSIAFRNIDETAQPGVWTATFIILLESAIFLAISFFVFLRRDVTTSQG